MIKVVRFSNLRGKKGNDMRKKGLTQQEAYSLLAVLYEKGCLMPNRLAAQVLELSAFRNVSQDDLRDLLLHLIEKKILCQYEDEATWWRTGI